MKKFFVFIVGLFIVGTVFAVGENIPTSKTYVDNAVAQKQNTISANNGVAQVLTNTGTPGSIGTKNIYDSSVAYETQTNSLVTAGTMNTAVQNAIDSEFVCIERNSQGECLLLQINNALTNGYTALEYIESTGTQYIDTGVPVDDNNSFKIVVAVTDHMYGYLLSQYNNSLRTSYGCLTWFSKTSNFRGCGVQPNRFYDISLGFNRMSVDGVDVSGNPDTDDAMGTNVFIFARNYTADQFASAKLKQLKIWNAENELVRDFIPARRNSDGELGLYDTVTRGFFTNSGTGSFVAGPVTSMYLPSGN